MSRLYNLHNTNRHVAKRGVRMLFTAAILSVFVSACASQGPLQPFTTDGCSRFPDRDLITKKDWCSCCVVHDLAYWRGGTAQERLAADQALKECVAKATGDAKLAETMYLGVRAGGGPELNTSFRWGYGWPFGRGYAPLNAAQLQTATKLEQQYRASNATLSCQ